jgi:mannosyltransferase
MEILYDNIIFSLQKSGGISVVWSEMIKRFLRQKDINIKFLEADNKENNIFRKELNIPANQIIELKYPFLYIQRYINPSINIKGPFIFHSSYYRVCKNKHTINITTVHDFTYEYFIKGSKKKIHCLQKYQAIRNSDYIICISENTKKDLLQFLPDVDENKIVVIPNGISEDYRIIPQAKFSKNMPFKKNEYLLFVGSRDTYKNFNLVLEAIAASKFKLVIVGKPLNDEEKNMIVKKKVSPNSYRCLDNISNQDLNLLYNNAFALLYPSSYEGFGIPVLEAQKAGCPVIAYNGSSIPEIIGDTPLLLNDLSVEAILSKLDIIHDNRQREYIIKKGIENASKYTWENTFNKVLSLYKKAWENT